jgi:hypothetical protein
VTDETNTTDSTNVTDATTKADSTTETDQNNVTDATTETDKTNETDETNPLIVNNHLKRLVVTRPNAEHPAPINSKPPASSDSGSRSSRPQSSSN